MRKTFPLEVQGHKPARVIELIHRDVRKYIKRERRKTLPEGVDFWDFDCRVGADAETAETIHVAAISEAINNGSGQDWSGIYVEILAKPGYRTKKPKPVVQDADDGDAADEPLTDSDESADLDELDQGE